MIKFCMIGLLSLALLASNTRASDEIVATQDAITNSELIEAVENNGKGPTRKAPVLSKVTDTHKKKNLCKITSSASEKWIKKNYKNCKKCGMFRNHSQKTYYCYCDCN